MLHGTESGPLPATTSSARGLASSRAIYYVIYSQ